MLVVLSSLSFAAPTDYLATGQTGAQTQLHEAHTSTWLFTSTIGFSLGGLFTMKARGSATADLTFSLYQGTDDTGLLLAAVDLAEGIFCGPSFVRPVQLPPIFLFIGDSGIPGEGVISRF